MKAYQIMMFLLCVNLGLFLVQNIPDAAIYDMNVTPIWTDALGFSLITVAVIFGSLTTGFAVNFWSNNATAMQYFMYMTFSGAFWSLYASTLWVFDGILKTMIPFGVSFLLYSAVTSLVIIIFAVGLMQMVTGGWKGFY